MNRQAKPTPKLYIKMSFEDPLSAGFPGVVGGNPDLNPEEADTITYGVVITPYFSDRLVITADYWNIKIEDAISSISSQNIVNSCYDSTSLNNAFCGLIARNPEPTSAQSGGLTFLRQAQLNFGSAEATGWDFTLAYGVNVGGFDLNFTAGATLQKKLEFVQPASTEGGDATVADELRESRRPEWSALGKLSVMRGPLTVNWQTQYLSRQVLAYEDGAEIETVRDNFGPDGFSDETFVHVLRMLIYN